MLDKATDPNVKSNLDNAQKAEDAAKSAADAAKASEDAAQKVVDNASKALSDAQKAAVDAQAKVDAAAKALSSANATKAEKDQAVTDAQTAVTAAEQAVKDAQAAYDKLPEDKKALTAVEFLDKYSAGTYTQRKQEAIEKYGSQFGADVVDGKTAAYDMISRSLDLIDELNKIRNAYGLSTLKVSGKLMADQAVEADLNDGTNGRAGHSAVSKAAGRNLAWGSYDPYGTPVNGDLTKWQLDGWMGEQNLWYEAKAKVPNGGSFTFEGKSYALPSNWQSLSTYDLSIYCNKNTKQGDANFYQGVGHYLNIIEKDVNFGVAGIGTSPTSYLGGNTHALGMGYYDSQYYSKSMSNADDTICSVDEYRALMNEAKRSTHDKADALAKLNESKDALANLKAALATAQTEAKDAADAVTKATFAKQAADGEKDAADAVVTAAQSDLSAAKDKLASAQKDYSAKQAAYESAAANTAQAQKAYDAATSGLQQAKDDLATAGAQRSRFRARRRRCCREGRQGGVREGKGCCWRIRLATVRRKCCARKGQDGRGYRAGCLRQGQRCIRGGQGQLQREAPGL